MPAVLSLVASEFRNRWAGWAALVLRVAIGAVPSWPPPRERGGPAAPTRVSCAPRTRPTDLGEGAETTAAVLRPGTLAYGGAGGFEFALLRFADGPARKAAMNRFRRSMTGFCSGVQQSTCAVIGQRPNGVSDYAPIDGIPEVLAALLAALGTAVLGQLAVVSGRHRRREFAILKALGLLRRQIREVTAWQVTIWAGLALLIGVPLGLAAGRWSWQLFGAGLGLPADARVPVTLVLVMVPAILVIANAVALWPGHSAARIRLARALRTE